MALELAPRIRANAGQVPVLAYLNGWRDVDGDGILDCLDPTITPTADNVDGDFLPDWMDPDLDVRHVPFTWLYTRVRP